MQLPWVDWRILLLSGKYTVYASHDFFICDYLQVAGPERDGALGVPDCAGALGR